MIEHVDGHDCWAVNCVRYSRPVVEEADGRLVVNDGPLDIPDAFGATPVEAPGLRHDVVDAAKALVAAWDSKGVPLAVTNARTRLRAAVDRLAREPDPAPGDLVLVRKDSGGVFPDGTTNHPAIDFHVNTGESEARAMAWSDGYSEGFDAGRDATPTGEGRATEAAGHARHRGKLDPFCVDCATEAGQALGLVQATAAGSVVVEGTRYEWVNGDWVEPELLRRASDG